MKIDPKRLKELERSEAKLNALEAGGVDNWEWYGDALAPLQKQEEIDDEISHSVEDILATVCEKVDEPAGHGCGYGVSDDCHDEIVVLITQLIKKIGEIEKEDA